MDSQDQTITGRTVLTDIEPKYDIRFVEVKGSEKEVQNLFKMPAIIGHEGTIKPVISNGSISKKHCTVTYDINTHKYRVTDGSGNKLSTNHIYYTNKYGKGEAIAVPFADLSELGEKVYLLRTIEGEAYIELHDAKKTYTVDERSTADLDPRLLRTAEIATEARAISVQNSEQISANAKHLEDLDGRLKGAFTLFDYVSNNLVRTILTSAVISLSLIIGTPALLIWINRDALADIAVQILAERFLHNKTELKK